MKSIYTVILLVLAGINCIAQNQTNKEPAVQIIARSYSDHIVLRFFASTAASFNTAIKAGYVIERADYKQGVEYDKLSYATLKNSPFKRWPDEKWEKGIIETDKTDTVSASLAALAYGLTKNEGAGSGNIMANGMESLKEEFEKQNKQFLYCLLAANRSKLAAEGVASSITDNDVVLNNTYVYRIYIINSADTGKKVFTYLKSLKSIF